MMSELSSLDHPIPQSGLCILFHVIVEMFFVLSLAFCVWLPPDRQVLLSHMLSEAQRVVDCKSTTKQLGLHQIRQKADKGQEGIFFTEIYGICPVNSQPRKSLGF